MNERQILSSWLYASQSTIPQPVIETTLAQIIALSNDRNASLDTTGALIFTGSFFAQYLEGPAPSIAALEASILRDPRHRLVQTIARKQIEQRRFAAWSLAYAHHAAPFDRLIGIAHKSPGLGGEILLLEMIRRFADAG